MKNLFYAMLVGSAFAAIIHFTPSARAQQSTYYTDRWGQPVGQAWTYGNQTFYSDAIGRPTGSAATNGPNAPQPMGLPYPAPMPELRIEPLRPIEPLQPLRMQ